MVYYISGELERLFLVIILVFLGAWTLIHVQQSYVQDCFHLECQEVT